MNKKKSMISDTENGAIVFRTTLGEILQRFIKINNTEIELTLFEILRDIKVTIPNQPIKEVNVNLKVFVEKGKDAKIKMDIINKFFDR